MIVAPPADVASSIHAILNAIVRALSDMSVLDWVLVAGVVALIAWGWVRAMAFARLGTIDIKDLESDDDSLGAKKIRAQLQDRLSRHGWPPHSGVPNGAPTPTNLAAAVADAPIDQAKWLSALIGLIPLPPSSTAYQLTGTVVSDDDRPAAEKYGLSYQLVCLGPRKSVNVDVQRGPDWDTVISAVANDVYRKIAAGAPEIYPRWSRWATAEALSSYTEGLDRERVRPAAGADADHRAVTDLYQQAYECYRRASELDPDNMLARLRAANCLERTAGGTDETEQAERFAIKVKALQAYLSIRLREPTIFEAGFRASVLLSGLANEKELPKGSDLRKLTILMLRYREQGGGRLGDRDYLDSSAFGTRAATPREDLLRGQLEKAARRESKMARRRLQPWSTIIREGRFRHRFEPRGTERRQLLKSLRMARWTQRARRAGRRDEQQPGSARDSVQLMWRAWVFSRIVFRAHIAGWGAHYNAACFYALLPQASGRYDPFVSRHVRRRALYHLKKAVQYSDGALPWAWARDEDRDLEVLRTQERQRFARAIAPICPDVATIHYLHGGVTSDDPWVLHVWGDAVAPADVREWGNGLRPTATRPPTPETAGESVFRVRIFDENKPLFFLPHKRAERDVEQWLIPAECPGSEVWVYHGKHEIEGPISAEILKIHYVRDPTVDGWVLHVWGDAIVPSVGRPWDEPLHPVNRTATEATFHVRIFDENRQLHFLAHNGMERDAMQWSVVPVECEHSRVWVRAGEPEVSDHRSPATADLP